MRIPFSAGLACLATIFGLTATPMAGAVTVSSVVAMPGGSCQLSIPTTNTGVRPKATGFRNESTTTSNFVICTITNPMVNSDDAFSDIVAYVYSLDGTARMVSCTAVAGVSDYPVAPPTYSTKTEAVDSSDTPIGQMYLWKAEDFGGTAGSLIKGSGFSSVTCTLPPQTAINFVLAHFSYDIGT